MGKNRVIGRFQDRRDALVDPARAQAREPVHPRLFEIGREGRVVDVVEGVHVAPARR